MSGFNTQRISLPPGYERRVTLNTLEVIGWDADDMALLLQDDDDFMLDAAGERPAIERGHIAAPAKPRQIISGYGVTWGSLSTYIERQRCSEMINYGALELDTNVRALINHDPAMEIASVKDGTLRIAQDHKGLKVLIQPHDTEAGRAALEGVRCGNWGRLSIGMYRVTAERHVHYRKIVRATLQEVSLCSSAVHTGTSVALI